MYKENDILKPKIDTYLISGVILRKDTELTITKILGNPTCIIVNDAFVFYPKEIKKIFYSKNSIRLKKLKKLKCIKKMIY